MIDPEIRQLVEDGKPLGFALRVLELTFAGRPGRPFDVLAWIELTEWARDRSLESCDAM